ncbi:MAG: LPS export ABC transporter periplasmic protein LptC [Pseudomonadota bacterium]|jgi:lipopolysaccharide export system protein LptC|uniref:LPS export ABC transporter periplasmic protein LptC n=1 Tax=Qipengyuania flava TaxID=192812 RepID=A0A222EQS9_9SPHN|nr:LPS export ABC transporter periplasmic protein LptC [Qipengyuania flava]KZX52251.1 LPS export ABC transporter periplasmic protein LptC [Erythrobacter sp. HI00D59]MEC7422074.1 LPS export ABC transporter periplasmic protein LptC [Pseudomonadota bacterium]OAN83837.1 LPS export ABC transporter periplasmic protein LptC [Erythrobacter sp. EhN03]ASP28882.1 LPS export ABC transporter periplasmic protein LptC [Qipengyuania flava]MBO9504048.1 LPS export ABC transporter periplasmic protein LptC [Qipen|tara:strand:- start:686 stop:1354 length:669 start_codon:yes stop_codon:yes gene_type:complete
MVFRQRRIETQEAKQRRSLRKHWAEPGGSHDRLVGFLARALPMGVGVLAALMVITPLSPRGEVSFLLDRNKVAVIDNRLRVDNALYRGADARGRPFSLTAGEAVQRSSAEGIVRMNDLVARLLLDDGPARLIAGAGQYDIDQEVVSVVGPMRMLAADGYRMLARDVSVDLAAKQLTGAGGVEGAIPAGTFSADRLTADLSARTITLTGNARLRMEPGKLRMP